MAQIDQVRRAFLGAVLSSGAALASRHVLGEDPARPRDQLQEPVFRVSKATSDSAGAARVQDGAAHPLDPALEIARNGLKHIQKDVADYTATLVKRERIKGKLLDHEYIFAKVRNRKVEDNKVKVPFAIYMYFLKPESTKGREALYVEGENDGKLVAHEGAGLAGKLIPSVWLKPESALAMNNNRYPITEAGIENLVVRLLEKGDRDRKRDECTVEFRKNAKINERPCTVLKVVHPVERDYFDFHIAEIFIDDEFQVPVRYAAYTWPAPGEKPVLQEEYTYLQLKLNVGLTATDFDYKNPDYNFVRRKS